MIVKLMAITANSLSVILFLLFFEPTQLAEFCEVEVLREAVVYSILTIIVPFSIRHQCFTIFGSTQFGIGEGGSN